MLIDELAIIVKKEKDVIPFLKKLTPTEKKALVPELKKLGEKVFEREDVVEEAKWGTSYSSKPTHSDKQREIINMAYFVCFNKTDARKNLARSNFLISDVVVKEITPWYTPKWYGDLINEAIPWQLTYKKIIELYQKELLQPNKDIVVNTLPNAIVHSTWNDAKHLSYYHPEELLKNAITLEEHIWYLFEEESTINDSYRNNTFVNHEDVDDVWIHTISKLINDGKIDRKKILIATIDTATKGFNKNLSGWFFQLFDKLKPTLSEILELQDSLYAALNSPHSKSVNVVLKYFKTVATNKDFKQQVFIENASILLASETKSIVNSTLMILDKIAKSNTSLQIDTCTKATEALLHNDEKIQVRAAKIIHKYGDSKDQTLLDEVNMYAEHLFHEPKELLSEYIETIEDLEEEPEEINQESSSILIKSNEIPTYETLDDLIFFISQVIDNNEVYHVDLVFNYLPKLYTLLNKDNVAKLIPIFKRSFDSSVKYEWIGSQIGYLELMVAYYINDLAKMLIKEYPSELNDFKAYREQKIKEFKKERYFNTDIKDNLKEIEKQLIPDFIYNIYRALLIKSKELLKIGKNLELLSVPTHAPCWIAPEVLVNRIKTYLSKEIQILDYDFQIAMGRLLLNEFPDDLDTHIHTIQHKEIKEVLLYHFGFKKLDVKQIQTLGFWIQSIVCKNKSEDIAQFEKHTSYSLQKERAIYDWDYKIVDNYYRNYDYSKGKYVTVKISKKQLAFDDFIDPNQKPSFLTGIKNLFKKAATISSYYQNFRFKKREYETTIQSQDDVKFLLLTPNNPSPYLFEVVRNNLKESTFSGETTKRNMVNILKGLHEIWYRYDYKESTYLFLATGFLCSDKVSREIAAEIWIKATSENTMNTVLLGEIIGKLQGREYAPMKRFTDILVDAMFSVSKLHNSHLIVLLDAMIGQMDDVPKRGIKKLLEIFLELTYKFPEIELSSQTRTKLQAWQQTKSIKTLIDKLI